MKEFILAQEFQIKKKFRQPQCLLAFSVYKIEICLILVMFPLNA